MTDKQQYETAQISLVEFAEDIFAGDIIVTSPPNGDQGPWMP